MAISFVGKSAFVAGVGGGIVLIDGRKTTIGPIDNATATVTNTQQVYITMALRAAPDAQVLTSQRFDNAQTFYTQWRCPSGAGRGCRRSQERRILHPSVGRGNCQTHATTSRGPACNGTVGGTRN